MTRKRACVVFALVVLVGTCYFKPQVQEERWFNELWNQQRMVGRVYLTPKWLDTLPPNYSRWACDRLPLKHWIGTCWNGLPSKSEWSTIRRVRDLRIMGLAFIHADERVIAELTWLPKLNEVYLEQSSISRQFIIDLARIASLRQLALVHCTVAAEDLLSLKDCYLLERLVWDDPSVSLASRQKLSQQLGITVDSSRGKRNAVWQKIVPEGMWSTQSQCLGYGPNVQFY